MSHHFGIQSTLCVCLFVCLLVCSVCVFSEIWFPAKSFAVNSLTEFKPLLCNAYRLGKIWILDEKKEQGSWTHCCSNWLEVVQTTQYYRFRISPGHDAKPKRTLQKLLGNIPRERPHNCAKRNNICSHTFAISDFKWAILAKNRTCRDKGNSCRPCWNMSQHVLLGLAGYIVTLNEIKVSLIIQWFQHEKCLPR